MNTMFKRSATSSSMPSGALYSLVFLIAGWVLHYLVFFTVFSEEMPVHTSYLQAALGIGICWGVATGRGWARMLCLFFNIAMIALYGLCAWVFAQVGNLGLAGVSVLIVLALAGCTLSLLRKDTVLYFKAAK
ncbi:MAG: hypothetical protein EHM15_03780 [Desulfobacteraceae bacterium]|nr:MAG: hypothetical protein EHM15_03780 [Desulfobacteraceae bacterium]